MGSVRLRLLHRYFMVIPVSAFAVIALCLAPFTGLYASQPAYAATLLTYRYTRSFDTTAGGNVHGMGVATDPVGDAYVTGYFANTVNFAGASGSDIKTTSSAVDNTFITKYKADGSYAWTKTFDITNGWANGDAITTDSSGNIYAAGQFSGTVVFDGVGGTDSQTDHGGINDAYLTKYNADGSYGWTKTMGTASGSAAAAAVATNAQGDLYLTGAFTNTVVFGGADTHVDASGANDTFVTKYNSTGSYAWTKSFDTTSGQSAGDSIAIDPQGNIYAGGVFMNTVVFDGVGGTDSQTDGSGNGDTYLTKYKPDGSYQWTKSFTTSVSGYSYGALGAATDPHGNIYLVGAISGTVTFNGADTRTVGNKGEVTLTKYNADGSYGWTKVLNDSGGWSYGQSVATDALGDVYTTGQFYQTVAFNGTGDSQTDAGGFGGAFITKYNADGSYSWTKIQDTTHGISWGQSIATDTLGNTFTIGGFEGTILTDGPGGTDSHTDAGGASSTFLTSYATFIPPVTPSVTSSTLPSSPISHRNLQPAAQSEQSNTTQTDPTVAAMVTPMDARTQQSKTPTTRQATASNSSFFIPAVATGIGLIGCFWLLFIWRRRRSAIE
jgi:hypothetical protein